MYSSTKRTYFIVLWFSGKSKTKAEVDSVPFFSQPVTIDIIIIYNSTDATLMKQTGIVVWRQRLD